MTNDELQSWQHRLNLETPQAAALLEVEPVIYRSWLNGSREIPARIEGLCQEIETSGDHIRSKEGWIEAIKGILEDPTDKRIEWLARAIVAETKQARALGFHEAKRTLQQKLNEMRFDLR